MVPRITRESLKSLNAKEVWKLRGMDVLWIKFVKTIKERLADTAERENPPKILTFPKKFIIIPRGYGIFFNLENDWIRRTQK